MKQGIILSLCCLLLVGCGPKAAPPPRDFNSAVTVNTENGYVTRVDIYLPKDGTQHKANGTTHRTTNQEFALSVTEPEELQEIIDSLKLTVEELEEAHGRMKFTEGETTPEVQ